MKVGVVFPQTEIGTNPAHIAEFARAAEEIGYDHLVARSEEHTSELQSR